MNSTPTPKAIEPRNALIALADEQLAHAYEQIARADGELARLSEELAKMERDAGRPPSAGPAGRRPNGARCRAPTADKGGAAGPRRLSAGGVHRCRCPGLAVVLWRRGQAGCRPLRAAARLNSIIAAGKSAASRAARSIHRSGGRGGGSTTANHARRSDRTAKRRADSY